MFGKLVSVHINFDTGICIRLYSSEFLFADQVVVSVAKTALATVDEQAIESLAANASAASAAIDAYVISGHNGDVPRRERLCERLSAVSCAKKRAP